MFRIWKQLKDQNVGQYVVFGKAEDSKLYKEAAFTNQITEAELNDMFKKGLLTICTGEGVFEAPVKVSANKAYTMGTVSSAVAFVEWAAVAAPTTVAKKASKK